MASINAGTVDVCVIARASSGWRVLTLQRALDTRCPGAWEYVHGRLEAGEEPEDAALRELREETGFEAERLYDVCVQPFYLHRAHSVELAVVFAAIVQEATPTLGPEHQHAEWLSPDSALERLFWPREKDALRQVLYLLANGDAGPAEDVLRVR